MVDKEHDREPKTWTGFAKTQMTTFSFFFDLQLGYSFYAITVDLQEALQEKKNVSYFRSTDSQSNIKNWSCAKWRIIRQKKASESKIFYSTTYWWLQ